MKGGFSINGWDPSTARHVIFQEMAGNIPYKADMFIDKQSNKILTLNLLVCTKNGDYLLENVICPLRNYVYQSLSQISGLSDVDVMSVADSLHYKLAVQGFQFYIPNANGINIHI